MKITRRLYASQGVCALAVETLIVPLTPLRKEPPEGASLVSVL